MFLNGMTVYAPVRESRSDTRMLNSEIPQRSALGPPLSLVMVNDWLLPFSLLIIFAGLVKAVGSSERDALGSDLFLVLNWAKAWDIPPNAGKSRPLPRNTDCITITYNAYLFTLNAVNKPKCPRIQVMSDLR